MSPVRRAPSRLTGTEASLRAAYLGEVTDLLWPHPLETSIGRVGPASGHLVEEFVVVPNVRKPRLLLPAGAPRAAATAVRHYSEPRSRQAKIRLELLALSMRVGFGRALMRDRVQVRGSDDGSADTIESYLTAALGMPVRVSLHIGPARANRKPVLSLLSQVGELLGFAKIGINDLTRRLVLAEQASLAVLAGASWRYTTVPTLLHAGRWRELEVLVQSALPIGRPRVPMSPDRLTQSMIEVASVGGMTEQRLVGSSYWHTLSARLQELEPGQDTIALHEAAAVLADRGADAVLRMGAWHGDWTPWNMASVVDTILLWDWERFTGPVPLGFDAVHYRLQRAVVRGGSDPRSAVSESVADSPMLLAPFGLAAAEAELTALLYLVDLAARYLRDGQAEAGARLGVLGQWLLPELMARVAAL